MAAMDADLLQKFNAEEYYRHFLADGLRPDGRGIRDSRAAELRKGPLSSAYGSASVRLGNSAALAGVRGEIAEAAPDQAGFQGWIEAVVELPALASAEFRERQRTLGLTTFLSNVLTDVLNTQKVFQAAQLNVQEGKLSWVLHVNVICLNYDGNAFDLCLLAALAALEDTKLPGLAEAAGAEVLGSAVRLVEAPPGAATSELVAEARRLTLISRPLPVTFAQLPGGQWVIDPCAAEESLGASVSLCLVGGDWLVFHQGGGADANRFLAELMPVARTCTAKLLALLDSSDGK